jgi:hypothetical protein
MARVTRSRHQGTEHSEAAQRPLFICITLCGATGDQLFAALAEPLQPGWSPRPGQSPRPGWSLAPGRNSAGRQTPRVHELAGSRVLARGAPRASWLAAPSRSRNGYRRHRERVLTGRKIQQGKRGWPAAGKAGMDGGAGEPTSWPSSRPSRQRPRARVVAGGVRELA